MRHTLRLNETHQKGRFPNDQPGAEDIVTQMAQAGSLQLTAQMAGLFRYRNAFQERFTEPQGNGEFPDHLWLGVAAEGVSPGPKRQAGILFFGRC